jgi:hypothetical protein
LLLKKKYILFPALKINKSQCEALMQPINPSNQKVGMLIQLTVSTCSLKDDRKTFNLAFSFKIIIFIFFGEETVI